MTDCFWGDSLFGLYFLSFRTLGEGCIDLPTGLTSEIFLGFGAFICFLSPPNPILGYFIVYGSSFFSIEDNLRFEVDS